YSFGGGNRSDDPGSSLSLQRSTPGTTNFNLNTVYSISFKNTVKGSMGGAFAGATYTFTTVAGGGNQRPQIYGGTDTQFEITPGLRKVDLRFNVNDFDGPTTPMTVTVQDDVDTFNAILLNGGPNSDFNYSSSGNEAGLTTVGVHTITYTLNDGFAGGTHLTTVKDSGFVLAN